MSDYNKLLKEYNDLVAENEHVVNQSNA